MIKIRALITHCDKGTSIRFRIETKAQLYGEDNEEHISRLEKYRQRKLNVDKS